MVNEYKLSVKYLKENFNYKNFCKEMDLLVDLRSKDEELWRLAPEITRYIVYHSLFNKLFKFNTIQEVGNETKEDIDWENNQNKIDSDYFDKKNLKLRKWMFNELCKGTLFEEINSNFKLIYHFPMSWDETLIFSKFNKRYYHFSFLPSYDDSYTKVITDVASCSHRVRNYFDTKLSKKEFFDKILEEHRRDGNLLIKGRDDIFFEDINNENLNYWHILSYDNFDEDAWDAQGEEERLKMKKKGLIK